MNDGSIARRIARGRAVGCDKLQQSESDRRDERQQQEVLLAVDSALSIR